MSKSKVKYSSSKEYIDESRNELVLTEFEVLNAEATDFPGNHHGFDDSWSFEKFKKRLKINIVRMENMEIEFDLIGVDPAIPNAFRRILLSDIPTMAFDKVFMFNNTSIIQDEVLAHRLGLIPLKADPRLFEFRAEDDDAGTPEDTLEFELKVKCSWNPQRTKDHTNPEHLYRDFRVLTSHLKWMPLGGQKDIFTPDAVGPVDDKILIAKMRPGHELDIKLHAMKGTGREHAKFSPVATAFYRLLPQVKLLKEVEGEAAQRLQKCFSPGVIDLVDSGEKKVAKVNDARYDICSRNVFRHEDLKEDTVKLTRARDHFIFYIESTGALAPEVLFTEAAKILSQKCRVFLDELKNGL
ncbi:hypothetical protein DAPPUDRAFT_213644 [Daphnia pulex]|uniref:DNA-directed RNA polymerases I and III subunit RPAC1 n=1 Tax=Daphnia pulex TaxID=6669 RepID=E9GTW6_DAPPU|nr:hypothetical protein DAPPUDRAFT_213644 [Daphnia pulex]|eukprot:EFX76928.1 hypothetical protein DAPPUDRAFT_213644 [Daphnia pulex]